MQQYISIYHTRGATTLLQPETIILLHMALCSPQAQAEALRQQQFPLRCEGSDFVVTFLALKHCIQSLLLYFRESLHTLPPPPQLSEKASLPTNIHYPHLPSIAECSLATANTTND